MATRYDETAVAEEIVSVLPAGVARVCSGDRQTIRFAVRAEGLRLRSIILSRASLRRLLKDAVRAVKIEYLQRDLVRSAGRRSEFRYPRLDAIGQSVRTRRAAALALPLVSMV